MLLGGSSTTLGHGTIHYGCGSQCSVPSRFSACSQCSIRGFDLFCEEVLSDPVRSVKHKKAPGPGGIKAEVLKGVVDTIVLI